MDGNEHFEYEAFLYFFLNKFYDFNQVHGYAE